MKHSMKFRSLLLASLRELALVAGPAVAQQKKPSSLIIWGLALLIVALTLGLLMAFAPDACASPMVYNLGMMGYKTPNIETGQGEIRC